jgi:hypothetical protein
MGKILIRARDRLAWHNQMARDVALGHVAFRVAYVIGSHFNNQSGYTYLALETIAKKCGVCRRTAWAAVEELAARGHLRVDKGGGRNVANTYRMILHDVGAAENVAADCTVTKSQTTQIDGRKGAGGCITTLKTSYSSNRKNSHPAPSPPRIEGRGNIAVRTGPIAIPIYSPEWHAWVKYYEDIGDYKRANLMSFHAETSRHGAWTEETWWPPDRQPA